MTAATMESELENRDAVFKSRIKTFSERGAFRLKKDVGAQAHALVSDLEGLSSRLLRDFLGLPD